jgi:hypothetical protein
VNAGFPVLTDWWSKSVTEAPNAPLKPDQIKGMCNITYPVKCDQCVLYAEKVELLYWPVSLMWKGNVSSTISPTVTPTTVYHGSTLTYGTAYLSYSNLADAACNMGPRYSEKIMAVPTTALMVVQGWNQRVNLDIEMTTVSLDMASLPPNPAATYLFDIGADINRPKTMWDMDFDYRLLFPPQIRELDPAWANCGFSWEATNDPPIALQSALSLTNSPTTTSTSQQTSPSPRPGESADPVSVSRSTSQSSLAILESPISSNTPEESTVLKPGLPLLSDSSASLTSTSPSAVSVSSTAAIANAIASALGLARPTTASSLLSDPITTFSTQGASSRQSGSDPVATEVIISDGQVIPTATITDGRISPSPATDSTIISGGQVLPKGQLLADPTSPDNSASTGTLLTVIGDHTIQMAGTKSGILIDSKSLQPGETTMIGTVPISAGAGFFEVNSQIVSFPRSANFANSKPTASLASGNFIIGSTTLAVGGSAITTLGHTYSIGTGGVVQDGATISTNTPVAKDSDVITVLTNGEIVVGSTTLSAGGVAITTLGHTISVGPSGVERDGTMIPISMWKSQSTVSLASGALKNATKTPGDPNVEPIPTSVHSETLWASVTATVTQVENSGQAHIGLSFTILITANLVLVFMWLV